LFWRNFSEELSPVVCFNKLDLINDKNEAIDMADIYNSIGYQALLTSAKTGEGTDKLFELLKNKRTALAGHSGVGKSSLINYIAPHLQLEVGEVSHLTNKGRHTTTRIRVFKLDEDTEVIDLPGVKLVDFIDIHRDEARFYFREFEEYFEACRFRDCLHLSEIDCAVKQAVADKKIAGSRYDSYLNIVDSL